MLLEKEDELSRESYYEGSVVRAPASAALAERITADVCVVGGGYAGLSAALELAARGYAVVLLEARRVGWGASGRNGGTRRPISAAWATTCITCRVFPAMVWRSQGWRASWWPRPSQGRLSASICCHASSIVPSRAVR